MRFFTCLLGQSAAAYPVVPGLHRITTFDGVKLTANSFQPVTVDKTAKFPVVIFGNSWDSPGTEYVGYEKSWAAEGYVVLEYEARGWFTSGGHCTGAGPEEMKDVSAVIDWILETFPHADPSAIGFVGVSYGGGMGLLAAAHDKRIRAVVAMSAWADIEGALNWNDSPSRLWGELLVLSGKVLGSLDPEMNTMWNNVMHHQNMDKVQPWAAERSPMHFLDQLNENKPAVFMSHNHDDNLFHSVWAIELWEALKIEKKIALNAGTHGSAELFPFAEADKLWGDGLSWMDRYLKGSKNGIDQPPLVEIQRQDNGLKGHYFGFESWPPPSDQLATLSFRMGPRQSGVFGSLSTARTTEQAQEVLQYAEKGVLTAGVFAVADAFKPVVPVKARLGEVDIRHNLVFATASMQATTVCGWPKLTGLAVVPTEDKFQLVFYLYSVDLSSKVGNLMTHSVYTSWEAKPGVQNAVNDVSFHSTCFEVPAGHGLALGIDMYDFLYEPASTKGNVTVVYPLSASLQLPVLHQHSVVV
mmetsp:Transcript_7949/g.18753  ORF Transcript_7949/g.18753 Transcript_7949/m.18753 type:complete len:526 (+) Transcript_7949:91-1668(+)